MQDGELWFFCAGRSLNIAQTRPRGLAQHSQPRNDAVSTETDKCTPVLICCGHVSVMFTAELRGHGL